MLKIGNNIDLNEFITEIETNNKYKFSFSPYYQSSILEQLDENDIDPKEFSQKFGLEYDEDEEYFTKNGVEYDINEYLPAWQELFNLMFKDEIFKVTAVDDIDGEYNITLATVKAMTIKEFINITDNGNIYLFGGEVADGDYEKLLTAFKLSITEN